MERVSKSEICLGKQSSSRSETIKNNLKKVALVVEDLDNSFLESQQNDRKLLLTIHMDKLKNQKLSTQLEEARKENKQLINVMQQKFIDNNASRSTSRSRIDISSTYSSVSMVHLQYKYEEMLANQEGLLKVLESKIKESQKCYKESEDLREEIRILKLNIIDCEQMVKKISDRYLSLKRRKDVKINKLKAQREALKLAHKQLLTLLNKQCLQQDDFLVQQLKETANPYKALLLQEVRRTNMLQHTNTGLQQEVNYLRNKLFYCKHKKKSY